MLIRIWGMDLRLLIMHLGKLISRSHSAYINLATFDCFLQSLSKTYPLHSDSMPPKKRRGGVDVFNTPKRKRTRLLQLQSCKTLMDISSEYTYMFDMIYNDWIFNKKSINCQGWKQLLQIDIFCNNLDINNVISYVKLICNILWKLSKINKD